MTSSSSPRQWSRATAAEKARYSNNASQ
jgi:hypothetical protein